jgi:DHA2 family methylenomycin A resistance protein-like MFS transporter
VGSRRLVVTVMCVGYFLVLLDVSIVNVALPGIGADLRAGVGALQWTVDAYAVALAALMLTAGTLGDLYGHKRIVLAGLALFGAGSAGCALAPSAGVLVGFRALSGVGAALLLPGTLAIITRAVPDRREQARAIGVWAAVGSVALPAGPVLGGALVDGPGWRWVFWINVPIVLVAGLVTARVIQESREPARRRPDVPGMVIGALALAVIVDAFVSHDNWIAPVLAVALLLLLAAAERRASDPMIPLPLLRQRGFLVANVTAGVMNLGTLGLLFVVTLFLQRVQGRTALAAGLALLPLFLPLSLLAPITGRLTARFGPRWPMVSGLLVSAAGAALLILVGAETAYPVVVPGLLLWGAGLGLLTPAVVAAAVRAAPGDRAGLASAANNTARQAGGAIGIAAYGGLAGDPGGSRFVGGFHLVSAITAAVFVVAAVVVLLTVDRGADRPAEANQETDAAAPGPHRGQPSAEHDHHR